jgi:UPF0176 protein
LCKKYDVLGALILAHEGINGTIASSEEKIDEFFVEMGSAIPEFDNIQELKFSYASDPPFYRMRIRIKPEIVTMGFPEINPGVKKGQYIEPEEWNTIISDPDTILIDTRNSYEVKLGTFKGAIDPDTETFREFPDYVSKNLDPSVHKKVAMFCTGGVRCEKASAYMLEKGFETVYHLKGGILKYLETVPSEKSMWEGQCYVFDQRISVGNGLQEGDFSLCRSCRHPLSNEERLSDKFEDGVCCPYCHDTLPEKKKEAARERNLQMKLAEERHTKHLGFNPASVVKSHNPSGTSSSVAAEESAKKQKKAHDNPTTVDTVGVEINAAIHKTECQPLSNTTKCA